MTCSWINSTSKDGNCQLLEKEEPLSMSNIIRRTKVNGGGEGMLFYLHMEHPHKTQVGNWAGRLSGKLQNASAGL